MYICPFLLFVSLFAATFHNFSAVNSQCLCYSNNEMFIFLKANGERFEAFFPSIQKAINEAENCSTIYVPSGIFYENVIVNKTVSLNGADGFS